VFGLKFNIFLFWLGMLQWSNLYAHPHSQNSWVAARGLIDVDRDGILDEIKIETAKPIFVVDPDPCASCGSRVIGKFVAYVVLSKTHRTVTSPIYLHRPSEYLWYWRRQPAALTFRNYSGRNIPEFNLGQFVNSTKWEYGLFQIDARGKVHRFAIDKPSIYVSPGNAVSTKKIHVSSSGIQWTDFGNAGEDSGQRLIRCHWIKSIAGFGCPR